MLLHNGCFRPSTITVLGFLEFYWVFAACTWRDWFYQGLQQQPDWQMLHNL
jgi:hypothetical protein